MTGSLPECRCRRLTAEIGRQGLPLTSSRSVGSGPKPRITHDLRMDAASECDRGRRVPKTVEADPREGGREEQRPERVRE